MSDTPAYHAISLAAKDRLRGFLSETMGDQQAADFVAEMLASSSDLVALSIKKGGALTTAEVSEHFAKRLNSGVSTLTHNQKVKCASAVIAFALDVKSLAAVKPNVWAKWYSLGYIASVSTVNIWGECWLPYQERRKIDEAVAKVKAEWADRKEKARAALLQRRSSEAEDIQLLDSLFGRTQQKNNCSTDGVRIPIH